MGLFDLANVRKAGLASKDLAGNNLEQLSAAQEHNAWAQNKAMTGQGNPNEIESLQSNPALTHEEEKQKVYSDSKTRMRALLDETATKVLDGIILPAINHLKPMGGYAQAEGTLKWVKNEIANTLIANAVDKISGFVMDRVTDLYFMGGKAVSIVAGTVFKVEAPIVQHVSSTHVNLSHVSVDHTDTRAVSAREEIHKVAETYGLEAEFLTMLLGATAELKARGKINLESNERVNVLAPEIRAANGKGEEVILKDGMVAMHGNTAVRVHAGETLTLQNDDKLVVLNGEHLALSFGSKKIKIDASGIAMTDGSRQIVMDGTDIVMKNGSSAIKVSNSKIDLNPASAPADVDFSDVAAPESYSEVVTTPANVPAPTSVALEDNVKKPEMLPQYEGINPIPYRIL